MEDTKNLNDSLSEVKIIKPNPIRLCPNTKKCLKSSLSSSTSTVNSERNMNAFNIEETKIDLENVSIEEINTDFFIYGQFLEEEQCQNEIYDILNNSVEHENEEENLEEKDTPKVKRCENPLKKELEMLNTSYFDNLIEDFNDLKSQENEEEKE